MPKNGKILIHVQGEVSFRYEIEAPFEEITVSKITKALNKALYRAQLKGHDKAFDEHV